MRSSLLLAFSVQFLFCSPGLGQSEHNQRATIGVLVDLHQGLSSSLNNRTRNSRVLCGSLNIHAFQQLSAVRWASEIINNKSWPGEFALDIVVHDTCGESGIALSETHQMLKWSKGNMETPLIGVIVIGSRNNERIIDKPLETLNKANISAVVTSGRAAELLLAKHPNVFTTAPDVSSVSEAILALLHQLGTRTVAVISSCSHAVKRFESIATVKAVQAEHFLVLKKDSPTIAESIVKFLQGKAGAAQSVVLLLESGELERLIRTPKKDSIIGWNLERLIQEKTWILGSVAMEQELALEWTIRFNSNLLIVQPHVPLNLEFENYFVRNVADALAFDAASEETQEYIQRIYNCQWPSSRTLGKFSSYPPCGNIISSTLSERFTPEADVGFIVSAVSAYSAALRLAQLEACKNETICDHSRLSTEVTKELRKLNFPLEEAEETEEERMVNSGKPDSTVAGTHELEGTRGRINHEGKLVTRKFDLFLSKPKGKISQVGQYSQEDGLILDVMLGLHSEPEMNLQDVFTGSARPLGRDINRGGVRKGKTAKESHELLEKEATEAARLRGEEETGNSVNILAMAPPELYISRVWAMVVVAIGITGVFLALYMLVYVLLRMCDGTLHGNQVLGILLLLGVMMMYASVVMFVLPPGPLLCSLRVFLPSLSIALCFGILLLKVMQLRALVSLGLGGRVSALNQFVTLTFIVAVQVAINVQWATSPHTEPTETTILSSSLNECLHSHETFLYLHSYVGFLILFVFIYGTSVLKIRRNYNEARWVTLSALLSLPVAIGWILVVFLRPGEDQEPAACIAFVSIASVILFSIFIPKLSTIAQQTSLAKRKKLLQSSAPGYAGSISTIFTTLSDRGHGTLQSQKRHSTSYPPQPPPMPLSNGPKSVTYSPRLTTNIFHSSSAATSLARSVSMKTPFMDSSRGAYP